MNLFRAKENLAPFGIKKDDVFWGEYMKYTPSIVIRERHFLPHWWGANLLEIYLWVGIVELLDPNEVVEYLEKSI